MMPAGRRRSMRALFFWGFGFFGFAAADHAPLVHDAGRPPALHACAIFLIAIVVRIGREFAAHWELAAHIRYATSHEHTTL
jgi:hypothetical protein